MALYVIGICLCAGSFNSAFGGGTTFTTFVSSNPAGFSVVAVPDPGIEQSTVAAPCAPANRALCSAAIAFNAELKEEYDVLGSYRITSGDESARAVMERMLLSDGTTLYMNLGVKNQATKVTVTWRPKQL